MRKTTVLLFLSFSFAAPALAETLELKSMVYAKYEGESVSNTLSTGTVVASQGLLHGHTVANTGENYSQWCRISVAAQDANTLGGGGYCVVIDEKGEMFWVWLDTSQPVTRWGVINGTGRYVGAAGGGQTRLLKTLPDETMVYESTGTLTLK